MTRAMENLVIIKINKVGNPFINSLEDCDGVLNRGPFPGLSINKSNQLLKYETIGMEHMYLDLCASNTQIRNNVTKLSIGEGVLKVS